ncbi:MAG: dephospho-CoA kinase [Chloroflexi bacterium]|nr:dephospho-CoA kinase [Chloroflexota bacterium]
MPYLIGLTGNIATGKSTVRRLLEELGAKSIDADYVVHLLYEKHSPTYHLVAAEFGPEILNPAGEINRIALGKIVFKDPAALKRLEAIVHPAVQSYYFDVWLPTVTTPVAVIEAVKLVESGSYKRCNAVWLVTANRDTQLQRLMATRSLSVEEASARLAAQPDIQAKLAIADVVIDNSGSLEETRKQVLAAWKQIPQCVV